MHGLEGFDSDRDRTVLAMSIARAWRDEDYKRRFFSDPRAVLEEEGVEVPQDVTIKVVEEVPGVRYVPLTREIDLAAGGDRLIRLLANLLPIPEGHEVRLIQSSERTRYFVFPSPSYGGVAGRISEAELLAMSFEATTTNTTETLEAETTEAAVTDTTEAQDAETSTTFVLEAELAAVAAGVLT
jgi:nitrile hydratase alpha subunit